MDFPDEYTALVTEKEGGLQEVNLKTGEKIPIAGLPDDLDQRNRTGIGDNSGLFAVKIDPDFKTNRWVYLLSVLRERTRRIQARTPARPQRSCGVS